MSRGPPRKQKDMDDLLAKVAFARVQTGLEL